MAPKKVRDVRSTIVCPEWPNYHGRPKTLSTTESQLGVLLGEWLFRGPMAWVMWLVNVAAGAAFLAGAYGVWRMFGTTDTLVAVKWGVVSLFLFQVTTMCKTFMGSHLEANRLLRELKRVELQVSLLRDRTGLASK